MKFSERNVQSLILPMLRLRVLFDNNEQCFLYVQVQVKIWRDYAHPRQLFQMIQILLYVFLFLSESIRIWLRIERRKRIGTETYTHVRCIFFHMLRVWKMLCRRVSFERNHTNECESQSLFQTYLDYLRALLISIEV